MKLFLSSVAISHTQGKLLLDLVGKGKPEDVKIALIENAADVYPEGRGKDWVYENREAAKAQGFDVDVVDLEDYRLGEKKGLLNRLDEADVIWLGGGNTYYLRWILQETRADSIITGLIKRGKVYGGGSAGAIVAGPTLQYFQSADSPGEAPEEITDGLHLTEIVVVPHWANEKYGQAMKEIDSKLKKDGLETICITDDQAVIIDDNKQPQVIQG